MSDYAQPLPTPLDYLRPALPEHHGSQKGHSRRSSGYHERSAPATTAVACLVPNVRI